MVEAANQYDKQPPDEKHINHISVLCTKLAGGQRANELLGLAIKR